MIKSRTILTINSCSAKRFLAEYVLLWREYLLSADNHLIIRNKTSSRNVQKVLNITLQVWPSTGFCRCLGEGPAYHCRRQRQLFGDRTNGICGHYWKVNLTFHVLLTSAWPARNRSLKQMFYDFLRSMKQMSVESSCVHYWSSRTVITNYFSRRSVSKHCQIFRGTEGLIHQT